LVDVTGAVTASGIIKTDDTTEATTTTDGSLQTDGGLSVVKSAVIGDDLDLLSNSAIFKIGVDQPFTLTHSNSNNTLLATANHRLAFGDTGEYISGDGTNLKIISSGDCDITATLVDVTGAVTASGIIKTDDTTEATTTTDGSLQTDGGLSVVKSAVIGNLTLANGSITDSSGVISFGDGNITNVGDINCNSISVDNASTGLDIVFGGNTTTNKLSLTNNLADALNITEGSNSYLKFVTTNSSEQIVIGKNSTFNGTTIADLGTVTTANIDGGTIDGTVIGGASPVAGTFAAIVGTSLSVGNVSTSAGFIDFYEDSDNGTNTTKLIGQASLSSDITITLPSTTGTLAIACFDISTLVTMSDDSTKTYGSLVIGDQVKSIDIENLTNSDNPNEYLNQEITTINGTFTISTVTSVKYKTISEYFLINNSIKVTAEHPLFVKREGVWKYRRVWTIQENDKLYTVNQSELNIDSIVTVRDTWLDVCTLGVENIDNYFAGEILAHNKGS